MSEENPEITIVRELVPVEKIKTRGHSFLNPQHRREGLPIVIAETRLQDKVVPLCVTAQCSSTCRNCDTWLTFEYDVQTGELHTRTHARDGRRVPHP